MRVGKLRIGEMRPNPANTLKYMQSYRVSYMNILYKVSLVVKMYSVNSLHLKTLVSRPLPDFISQQWRLKWDGDEAIYTLLD